MEMDAKTKDAIIRGAKALDAASFAMSFMAQQESGPLAEMFAIWLMEEADRLAIWSNAANETMTLLIPFGKYAITYSPVCSWSLPSSPSPCSGPKLQELWDAIASGINSL